MRGALGGQNRAIVIASDSSYGVITTVRITSVRWWSYVSPKTQKWFLIDPGVQCSAVRITRLAFSHAAFASRRTAEWPARVDRVRWTPAIGDRLFCPSKITGAHVETQAVSFDHVYQIWSYWAKSLKFKVDYKSENFTGIQHRTLVSWFLENGSSDCRPWRVVSH